LLDPREKGHRFEVKKPKLANSRTPKTLASPAVTRIYPQGRWRHEPLLQQLPHRERGPQVPGTHRSTFWPSAGEASAAQGRQLQRVLQAHFRGVGQLRGGHLHHPRGHQVAPHVCNLLAVLHPLLADFRLGLLAHSLPPRRPAERWPGRHALRGQRPLLHGGVPLLPGDPDHHRLRLPLRHRGVPGGRAHGHPAVHPELRHQHLHHRGGPGQDGHGQEERRPSGSATSLVGMRDGKLCLMWRIGDFRPNHVVEGTVRAQLLRYAEDGEGRMTMAFKDLRLLNDQIILVTPVTVVHEIDCDSPLYALDRKAVARDNFEILVTFIYTGDSTGTSHQSRSSYIPREILWGHRFHDVLEVKRKYYKVNCLQFEGSVEVYAPSAAPSSSRND
uniref:Inward rectifier potassium channel C-terminal domain-containing protein n=1 Tax=Bos mutus grunniens TaxID=30521 RepID=A0A8B9YY46_BOSMU